MALTSSTITELTSVYFQIWLIIGQHLEVCYQYIPYLQLQIIIMNHPLLNELLLHMLALRHHIQTLIATYFPITNRLDNFQNFLLLNLMLFVFCWIVGFISNLELGVKLSPQNIKRVIFRFAITYIPPARKALQDQLEKIGTEIHKQFKPEQRSQLKKIPRKPIDADTIGNDSEIKSLRGYDSGSRYAQKNHCEFVSSLSANFLYANPLHSHLHPQVRQMQIQVIKMTAKLLNFTEGGNPVGVFTSGGTQSILMAILAYREFGRTRGITKPNFLIAETGHAASRKACSYFDIQARTVKCESENYGMDIADMKSKIDSNTIGVYVSYPNFPYGTIDPIDVIAEYCRKRNICVHMDMCLGGFVVPFLKKQGKPMLPVIPKGITSISVDPHKYGLSGKGASILLYSSKQIRKHQFFATSNWPGGLYGTPGIAGSRSGVAIASAWISMMKMGHKGYEKTSQNVQDAVFKLDKVLRELGFKVFGSPEICAIGFCHPLYPVNTLQTILKRKWGFSVLQKPLALHYSFTPLNSLRIDEMVKDVRQCINQLKNKNQVFKESGQLELYGAMTKIPDGLVKMEILGRVLDAHIDV